MKDELFIRGEAPMTKEEIRAIALSKLDLHNSMGLLDVGAGTGTVSIEAKIIYKELSVTAIEQDQNACTLIQENCNKFQIQDLTILKGRAPNVKVDDRFDRFFIGGTEGELESILSWIRVLGTGECIVVVTCITHETQMEAYKLLNSESFYGLETIQINIQKLEALGRYHYYKPSNGITLYKACFKGETL
jgi:cobalt-precorrin-6B (C15)-methyltransferase